MASQRIRTTGNTEPRRPVEINAENSVASIAFFPDGEHIVGSTGGGKIQRWQTDNNKETGIPMNATLGSTIFSIAVSRDGKWVVCGTKSGEVMVWDATNHAKVKGIKAHRDWVRAVDISPEGSRVASGSDDRSVSVWSFYTGKRLLGPLRHDYWVPVVRFSPNGRLLATAHRESVRVYDGRDGRLICEFPMQIAISFNNSLAWASDSRRLFTVTGDKNIHCLDVSAKTTITKWPIHSDTDSPSMYDRDPRIMCIALASNDAFIAASCNRSASLWDTTTYQQIGSIIFHNHPVWSMVISSSHVAMGGKQTITLHYLRDTFPIPYRDHDRAVRSTRIEKAGSQNTAGHSVSEQDTHDKIADLEKAIGEPRMKSSTSQSAAEKKSGTMTESTYGRSNNAVTQPEALVPELLDAMSAIEELELDTTYQQYKRKHAALHRMERYGEAFKAFEAMLSEIEKSPDPVIRKLCNQYIDTTPLIHKVIEETISNIPTILINVSTGRLCDRELQIAAFKALPIYEELRSSMTTPNQLDYARIQREVEKFYEYVMFSHKWQPPYEPTFSMLEDSSIDQLHESLGTNKLRGFCEVVRFHKFLWCWCDTCCINQADKGVHQESVVAMFRWYRKSALTVVHLLGVLSNSQEPGCLWKSVWNTRGWTYQEYIASPVVQFYTEDWKPYLGLDMFNHKEAPAIRMEMERVTKVATQVLATLEPGLDRAREKLYLASRRQTTRGEDIAYSLFGIFGVSIPVIYGEGKEAAVRRLLEYILTHSTDVTLLSWMGNAGSDNSFLPADLTVYDQIAPPHLPQAIKTSNIDSTVTALQSSAFNITLVNELYEQLYELPPLALDAGRLRLSGLVFPLTDPILSPSEFNTSVHTYRTTSSIIGDIEITTVDELSRTKSLLLIHPWTSPLLDEDFSDGMPLFDLESRALRLVVRLNQPFGALLLVPKGRSLYQRAATDSYIKVRIAKETSLKELQACVRTVFVR